MARMLPRASAGRHLLRKDTSMAQEFPLRSLSRRSMLKGSMGATAAAIAGMTFPRVMHAQTPVASIPEPN